MPNLQQGVFPQIAQNNGNENAWFQIAIGFQCTIQSSAAASSHEFRQKLDGFPHFGVRPDNVKMCKRALFFVFNANPAVLRSGAQKGYFSFSGLAGKPLQQLFAFLGEISMSAIPVPFPVGMKL